MWDRIRRSDSVHDFERIVVVPYHSRRERRTFRGLLPNSIFLRGYFLCEFFFNANLTACIHSA